jgi:hypothetical protein
LIICMCLYLEATPAQATGYCHKLSIKLSIYKSGANREEMDDVLYCTPKLRYLT